MPKRSGMTPVRRRREKKVWRKLERDGKRALQQKEKHGRHQNLESPHAAGRALASC